MFLIVYIVGCVVSYLLYREIQRSDGAVWTVRERLVGLWLSCFSWLLPAVTIIGVAALIIYEELKDLDRPAKW